MPKIRWVHSTQLPQNAPRVSGKGETIWDWPCSAVPIVPLTGFEPATTQAENLVSKTIRPQGRDERLDEFRTTGLPPHRLLFNSQPHAFAVPLMRQYPAWDSNPFQTLRVSCITLHAPRGGYQAFLRVPGMDSLVVCGFSILHHSFHCTPRGNRTPSID